MLTLAIGAIGAGVAVMGSVFSTQNAMDKHETRWEKRRTLKDAINGKLEYMCNARDYCIKRANDYFDREYAEGNSRWGELARQYDKRAKVLERVIANYVRYFHSIDKLTDRELDEDIKRFC